MNQSALFLDGGKAPPQRFQRTQVVEGAGLQLQLLTLVLEQAVDLLVLAMNPLLHPLAAILDLAAGMLVLELLPQQNLPGLLLLQPSLHGLDQAGGCEPQLASHRQQLSLRVLSAQSLDELGDPLALLFQLFPLQLGQSRLQAIDSAHQLVLVGGDRFRRYRGCRGAQIGGEIGDGEIDFVADAADDRQLAVGDHPCQLLVVEAPQVFQRAAAANQQQHIAFAALVGNLDCAGDRTRGLFALYRHRVEDDPGHRRAAPDHGQGIADGRSAGRGDDADTQGRSRHGLLAALVEQAFVGQPLLQGFVFAHQAADAGFFQVLDDELEFASRLVEGDLRPDQYLLAIPRPKTDPAVAVAEHGCAQLRTLVLQREIPVAGGRCREVGDLALQPDAPHPLLEQRADLEIERGYAPDGFVCGGGGHGRVSMGQGLSTLSDRPGRDL